MVAAPIHTPVTFIHAVCERLLSDALSELGWTGLPPRLVPCPRPEMGDACVALMREARALRRVPLELAADIAAILGGLPEVGRADAVAPGYVNVTFADAAIVAALMAQSTDPHQGVPQVPVPERVVLDFGGPNVKPMHVGHLRSLVIGESLRRLLIAVGHDVVSDIHLGDWGLPSGMILAEIRLRHPEAPWFAQGAAGPFPLEPPITVADIATLYPEASAACKADLERMGEARAVTAALQSGNPGLTALWTSVVALAKRGILDTCGRLGAHFDLTLGESDAQPDIPPMLATLEASGTARRDGGALVIDVSRDDDTAPMPPLVLEKGDGATLYATTDLAAMLARRRDLGAERVLYVVDGRQSLHFAQLFRAAERGGIASGVALEHIAFGTVNGPDGKPFRTRAGGVMGLEALLDLACASARTRLVAGGRISVGPELDAAAEAIGIAALRVADLASDRESGYALDLDRAVAFDGRTGPYLLYALVRLRGVLARANGDEAPPRVTAPAERRLAVACLGFGAAVARSAARRAPNELTTWAFELAAEIGRFWAECPVSSEPDPDTRVGRAALCAVAERSLAAALWLLGCQVPSVM